MMALNLNWKTWNWKSFVNDANEYYGDNLNFAECIQGVITLILLGSSIFAILQIDSGAFMFQFAFGLFVAINFKMMYDIILNRGKKVYLKFWRPMCTLMLAGYIVMGTGVISAAANSTEDLAMASLIGTLLIAVVLMMHLSLDTTWFETLPPKEPLKNLPTTNTNKDPICNPPSPL